MQVECFQEQHGKEQQRLMTSQPSTGSYARAGIASMQIGQGERTTADVGIATDLVGVGVVPVVLGDPPAVTESDQEIAVQAADQDVDAFRPRYLVMPSVMPDEGGLSEHHREEHSDQQLPP